MYVSVEELQYLHNTRRLDEGEVKQFFHSEMDCIKFLLDEYADLIKRYGDWDFRSLKDENARLEDEVWDLEREVRDLQSEIAQLQKGRD